MKKEFRIKKTKEIDSIIKAKHSVGNKYFVIYKAKNNETSHFRFAISIGRKYGIAVERNLMKRRIREIIRNINPNNYDYVIVVKKASSELSFDEINQNLLNLFKRGV